MNSPLPRELNLEELEPDIDLAAEYRALQEFLHLAPVGLLRTDRQGTITMMNPMAAQMLGPIGLGQGDLNLFSILEPLSPDIRLLVQTFHDDVGVICDNYRVMLPVRLEAADAPEALGVTVMRVSSRGSELMVVVTDQTSAVKLQRMQASWIR